MLTGGELVRPLRLLGALNLRRRTVRVSIGRGRRRPGEAVLQMDVLVGGDVAGNRERDLSSSNATITRCWIISRQAELMDGRCRRRVLPDRLRPWPRPAPSGGPRTGCSRRAEVIFAAAVRAVRGQFAAGHGHKRPRHAFDDLQVPHHEGVVKGDRTESLEPLSRLLHELDANLGDSTAGLLQVKAVNDRIVREKRFRCLPRAAPRQSPCMAGVTA